MHRQKHTFRHSHVKNKTSLAPPQATCPNSMKKMLKGISWHQPNVQANAHVGKRIKPKLKITKPTLQLWTVTSWFLQQNDSSIWHSSSSRHCALMLRTWELDIWRAALCLPYRLLCGSCTGGTPAAAQSFLNVQRKSLWHRYFMMSILFSNPVCFCCNYIIHKGKALHNRDLMIHKNKRMHSWKAPISYANYNFKHNTTCCCVAFLLLFSSLTSWGDTH